MDKNVFTIVTSEREIPFNVVLIENDRPIVEFYDARYNKPPFPPIGQFVSRYYLETLLDRNIFHALDLCGHVDEWYVDAFTMNKLMEKITVFHDGYLFCKNQGE